MYILYHFSVFILNAGHYELLWLVVWLQWHLMIGIGNLVSLHYYLYEENLIQNLNPVYKTFKPTEQEVLLFFFPVW